jgi:uncharacterized protein (TIGR03790 family)
MKIHRFFGITVLSVIFCSAAVAETIQPDQILIIGSSNNSSSLDLAKFYAKARNIPGKNILLLDVPDRDEISETTYSSKIADPVRSFIKMQKAEKNIKVLVTLYGVPLRVQGGSANPRSLEISRQLRHNYFSNFQELEQNFRDLEKLARISTTQPTTLPGRNNPELFPANVPQILKKIETLYRTIINRIQTTSDRIEQESLGNQFIQLRLNIEGGSSVLQLMGDPVRRKELAERLEKIAAKRQTMTMTPADKRNLEEYYQFSRELGGLFLVLKTINEDYSDLTMKDSSAAIDSELTMLLWKSFKQSGRIQNGLNTHIKDTPMFADSEPILMVSRLDGPNPSVIKRMIRDSIETEKKGLFGKVTLDARGINDKNGYYTYDQDIRDLASFLKSKTDLTVKLDDRPEVLKADSAPDTALYCGWYSLRNYIPACTFVKGAVGYHIASFEATTLHNPNTKEWCANLLKDGLAATVGPVEEPYLDAFPLPSEFFRLLLTGKYPLVEVYFKTVRYNSWRMILLGDPLYRPFAQNPVIKN